MLAEFSELYIRYNKVLKPLISEIEGRLEQFEEPLLKNITIFFDSLALYHAESDVGKKEALLSSADAYLDICISQSYQYLIYALELKVRAFTARTRNMSLNLLDDGKFIGQFSQIQKQAEEAVRSGRHKKDDINGLPFYRQAYESYLQLESLIDSQAPLLIQPEYHRPSLKLSVVQWTTSILISILAGLFHNELESVAIKFWNSIRSFLYL